MGPLPPGANAPLAAGDQTVLIRHGAIPGAEIDVSAFLVTGTGKVRSDADMCFYGQPSIESGAVILQGAGNGETRFLIAPGRVPAGVEKVILTATIHENVAAFGRLSEISLDVNGVRGRIPCGGMTETALILAELYRRNGAWKVRVVGQGFNGGLAALATHLGVEIAEPTPPTPASEPPKADPKPQAGPITLRKGQTLSLEKPGAPRLTRVFMGLGWDPVDDYDDEEGEIDLDASVIVFDRNGQELESVSFYNLASYDGSIQHAGDNLTGDGEGDDEIIHVDLGRISREAAHLVFTVTSYQGQTFDEVDNAFARLVDAVTGAELCRYTLRDQGAYTAVIMVCLSRMRGGWTIKALGSACDGFTVDEVSDFARQLI
jgi:stress response protein SCP2